LDGWPVSLSWRQRGDAFDQPAVEEGKVLAKKYLTGG